MLSRWMRIVAVALAVAAAPTATAGDGWRVVDTAGGVRFGGTGMMPVALTRDQELPGDAWIETSANGRVVLAREQETIVVEPNSRVMLPTEKVNGNTQILQTLGSALYKIGKQKKPHFQVDTPYMAAVVKGTAFVVKVEDDEASVEVTEGLVEVSTPGDTDMEFVRPGFTAVVAREQGGNITVDPTPGKTQPEDPAQPAEKSAKTDSTGGQTIVITEPIGAVEVDVKEVSRGLATDDLMPTTDVADGSDRLGEDKGDKTGGGHDVGLGVGDDSAGGGKGSDGIGGGNGNSGSLGNGSGQDFDASLDVRRDHEMNPRKPVKDKD